MTTSEEIKAEYTSSLADLTCNSKPLINVLTMLAEENLQNSQDIVEAIETHLSKVRTEVKLPILYLIDCIVKNVGRTYTTLFSQNIVSTFCSVFKEVEEKTRAEMFKLRQTWNDVFPQKKLYAIDVQINCLDPAWPVTAAPPSNSIHLNPKFLTTNTNTKQEVPVSNAATINKETLKMQEQLIQKQKELLELQQKKLELEVLQTQVKLQEQIKTNIPSSGLVRQTNILLKPEVAKQMVPSTVANSSSGNTKSKPVGLASSIMGQRSVNSTPRINPVNSALVSAVSKPIRDPRLLRHQQKQTNNSNSRFQLGQSTLLDSNKIVTNKMSVRDSRIEPRLVNNKVDIPSQKLEPTKPKTFSKSRLTDAHKSTKSSRSITKTNSAESDTKSNSSKSGSATSLDSPTKSKSEKSVKSLKHKKKDNKYDDKNKSFKDLKRDKSHKSDSSPTAFKGMKSSAKNRNYIRRNLATSPELVQDEDLRSFGPPEKQARLLGDSPDKASKITSSQGGDLDLRQLPSVIGKKRSSPEPHELQSSMKKSKTQVFDVLFGNEDTDLRQIPGVNNARPPPPPPPIISSSDNKLEKTDLPKKPSNLDAVRAKLANATNRDKIFSKSFNKKKMNSIAEDRDLRVPHVSSTTTEISDKIIISPDDEQCIKSGTLTKEREKQLLNTIILQMEKSKLREAKKKDHEESFGNISLQPISDDELDGDYSDEERAINRRKRLGDKDDRIHTGSMLKSDDGFVKSGRDVRRGATNYRGRRRPWDPPNMGPHNRAAGRPWLHQKPWRHMGSGFTQPQHSEYHQYQSNAVPTAMDEDTPKSPDISSELVVDSVNQDDIKTINIDAVPRDIRYYDETAIIFMSWDDPREISFQNGARRVIFNDNESYIMSFNDPYKDVLVNGTICKVRLGAPSREIYINGSPYECYFGGPSITIDLNGTNTTLKLDGPAPQVKIGTVKRTDLVAGKVNLIVNAKTIVPVFLDAKLQKFVVDGETVTLKFVDALKTVLINDVPFNVEFGGLPKPITIHNKKHFIRFSVLPRNVKPGHVNIKDMEGCKFDLSPRYDENSQDAQFNVLPNLDTNEPALPAIGNKRRTAAVASTGSSCNSPERNSNSPQFFQNLLQQQNLNNLDVLSNVMASSIIPASISSGYQVENISHNADSQSSNQPEPASTNITALPSTLNINELFQKLVATGIVTTGVKGTLKTKMPTSQKQQHKKFTDSQNTSQNQLIKPVKKNFLESLKPVLFGKPETLKVRQSPLYAALYSGMQCSSCGMRFPPEQSMHYSQHLDWHFRQNRKGKKNIRVAASRRWYYTISDWKNYEEIEDLEEREKNFFDQQMTQSEGTGEDAEEEVEIPSVPADPNITDGRCEVCHDNFDQFFNEEKEEWHLRNAIRVDDKTYHPLCYEDYQTSLLDQSIDDGKMDTTSQDVDTKQEEVAIPGLEIILDDDEDEEQPEEKDSEVLIEESDDSKPISEEDKDESEEHEEDDDVILNEVAPIKIVVDDDDDYNEPMETIETPVVVKKEPEIDDGFVDVGEALVSLKNGGEINIKAEPIDPDDIQRNMETGNFGDISMEERQPDEEEASKRFAEPTRTAGLLSMDGNIELELGIPAATNKIKINISKPLPVIAPREPKETVPSESESIVEPIVDPSQPLPPGEEPVLLNLKPALQGVELKKYPPVNKGTELSGLCSIM